MSHDFPAVHSDWGVFGRASTTLTDSEVLIHDWYVADGDPELLLRTADATEAKGLLPHLAAFFAERAAWHRRATDAVVTRFGDGIPTPAELADAETDLVLTTVEAHPGGDLVLHLDDSCRTHFLHGHWPAVRFGEDGSVKDVTVEA